MKPTDLRGAASLAAEGTLALADLVEAMHAGIARVPLTGARLDGRTTGITGLVYKSIRGVTRLVGGSVDALLGLLSPALAARVPGVTGAEREAILAALNGVLGDHLAASGNPLSIPMAFRIGGRALVLERTALRQSFPKAGGDLLVLLHGLCMNDLQWKRDGHDHGEALARDRGFTPVYLHYNSGLHVSTNGRELAAQLQALLDAWPCPVRRLVLLGHSMGGLVARSALYYGKQARHPWVKAASDLVCLGTPHHGAPLERIGHGLGIALASTPYAAPLARLVKLRGAGITDLRHGYIRDEDWDEIAHPDTRGHKPVPLPRGVRCFALAASTGKDRADLKGRLIGDGLVTVRSALGQHADPKRTLAFKPSHRAIAGGTNHMQLLGSPVVLAQLQRWLGDDPATGQKL